MTDRSSALRLRRLIMAAMFVAIGFYLPFLTGQVPQIGGMLLPMHIPVLLCGFVCGWPWGLAVGAIVPLMRSLILAMPPLYPTAVAMAFELAAYGLITGLLYRLLPKKPGFVYLNLVAAMLGGRLVWGVARTVLAGLQIGEFSLALFWAGGFANAAPGILLQLVLIPPVVLALERAGVLGPARGR